MTFYINTTTRRGESQSKSCQEDKNKKFLKPAGKSKPEAGTKPRLCHSSRKETRREPPWRNRCTGRPPDSKRSCRKPEGGKTCKITSPEESLRPNLGYHICRKIRRGTFVKFGLIQLPRMSYGVKIPSSRSSFPPFLVRKNMLIRLPWWKAASNSVSACTNVVWAER